ncbi:MAG TPA: dihydroorotate dehydrogenase [Candidatus Protoclostridium stercorigallinarum]|uniref:Dihydroorotate dehydrogenase n=1 Tax=Candidatus Protoclostridium stercorigallinarum TaxID=2838741 RepID=A0A9D1Q0W2_9FIRM|nr:dihydroorotate dehydrogenase [Candidatus Protoclostridium stercorigallinarum]
MNTSVDICGVKLKNPVLTASGTFGFGREYNEFYDVGLLGGIVGKGLTLEPREGNDGVRIAETPSGMLNCVGLQNPGVEAFIESELPFMRALGCAVIANAAGSTLSDYERIVERLSDTDVDMIEMNISCPNVAHGGMAFGVLPKSVEEVTAAAKKHCGKPLIVKLSPNVANIADNARAAEAGGADALSLINTITGMAVDLYSRRPLLGNVTGGLSGPCVKPVALRMVREVYKAVKLPIIGMGGITTAKDVLEFMLCGATAVEVGTANISDPLAALRIVEGLESEMEKCGITDISELTGALED